MTTIYLVWVHFEGSGESYRVATVKEYTYDNPEAFNAFLQGIEETKKFFATVRVFQFSNLQLADAFADGVNNSH